MAEREADIEDGWGDDTWGGGGSSTRDLAANLRLSEDKVEGLVFLNQLSASVPLRPKEIRTVGICLSG